MDRETILKLNLSKENQYKIIKNRSEGVNLIDVENVVSGIKFIVENPNAKEDEMVDGLLEAGCNFDFEDIKNQFQKDRVDAGRIEYGLIRGDFSYASWAIAIMMYGNETDRKIIRKRFMQKDDNKSFYHFIRKMTNDETYTKTNIENYLINPKNNKSIKLKKEL